jgi:RNA polymerase sigma-70 factor, ECF subfamily
MRFRRDPLDGADQLIPRVYAYVAYRIGHGPDAEDVTSECFERALRYRHRYDARRGEPLAWLIGIARRLVADHRPTGWCGYEEELHDESTIDDLSESAVRRLSVRAAVAQLGARDQELVALRYGADLTARQIGTQLEMSAHAVEVALARVEERLRSALERRLAPELPLRNPV